MHLRQLTYYVAIIECKSINKAAQKLYVSQSTLSQSIQALERELGFDLVVRSAQGITPTDMGLEVFHDAQGLLRTASDLTEHWKELSRERNSLQGLVRITVLPSVYTFIMERVVERIGDKYPNIKCQLLENRRRNFMESLLKQRADLGVYCYLEAEEAEFKELASRNEMTVTALCPETYRLAVSVNNPVARESEITKEAAEALSLCFFAEGDDIAQMYFMKYFCGKPALEFHSFEKMAQVCANDFGVSLLPETMSKNGVLVPYGTNSVRFMNVDGVSVKATLCILSPRREMMSPESLRVMEMLTSAFQELKSHD